MPRFLTRLRGPRPHCEPPVHLHAGGLAGAYVCENPRCTSPHLAEEDLLKPPFDLFSRPGD